MSRALLGRGIEVVPGHDLLRDIRMVKTPREMAQIRAAARKTELALQVSAEALAAGANCAEAERVFCAAAALAGGRAVFLLITPYRPNVGRLAKTATLEPGDTVTFDATAEFDHYTSDIGRTAVIGKPNAGSCAATTRRDSAGGSRCGHFRAGAKFSEVEQAVTACIQRAGNPEFRGCGLHSVGLEHTDHPHPGGGMHNFDLVDGMVHQLRSAVDRPDIGKFHFEDLVYLQSGNVEILNDATAGCWPASMAGPFVSTERGRSDGAVAAPYPSLRATWWPMLLLFLAANLYSIDKNHRRRSGGAHPDRTCRLPMCNMGLLLGLAYTLLERHFSASCSVS